MSLSVWCSRVSWLMVSRASECGKEDPRLGCYWSVPQSRPWASGCVDEPGCGAELRTLRDDTAGKMVVRPQAGAASVE